MNNLLMMNNSLLLWSAGFLTLVAPLDFEVSHEYYLSVEGSRGKSSLSDITTVIINVTDVNDNTPVFGRGDYSAEITEDLIPGGLVMKVEIKTHKNLYVCVTNWCKSSTRGHTALCTHLDQASNRSGDSLLSLERGRRNSEVKVTLNRLLYEEF